jgi:isopentenyl diphosphate isomerase/L-lactate dehydrogenase-like FMN-dependent dehydrogenase
VTPDVLLSVSDYEAAALAHLSVADHGYFAGGAGDESTLRSNVSAFGRWYLRPRVLVDVSACTTTTRVLGQEIAMPLLVAPLALQRVGHPEGELAMAHAARAAGTIMCLSTIATATPAEVAATGVLRWFQLYAFDDAGLTSDLIAQARGSGFGALVLTVDAPVRSRREREQRSGFAVADDISVAALADRGITLRASQAMVTRSLTWADVERFARESGLPVVLKGILTAEDARLACEHGAAGVVVSNHGGRQLDGVLAAIDALPDVAEAVDGRIEVLFDGGIRRGTDVVKALALGARAVLAGRAPFWGLVVDGEAGASRVLQLLHEEILLALQLLGCNAPGEVTRAHVTRGPHAPRF